jgi:uncharacterized protein (TIGR02265 family)
MKIKKEVLGTKAAVKATMLQAHLAWAEKRLGGLDRIGAQVDPECAKLLPRPKLATDWIPFRCLIQIDRAIATAVGGSTEQVFRDLGRYSATTNLGGVYKSFIAGEPHRFFGGMSVLHSSFQNFGRTQYERRGDTSGAVVLDGYTEYSPVHCATARGYFEEALRMMHAPGPVTVSETACQCAGDGRCVYEMSW